MNAIGWWRVIVRVAPLVFLATFTFVGCEEDATVDTQAYALAYPAFGEAKVRVFWSDDGVAWTPGAFRPDQGNWTTAGVGLAAVPSKDLFVVGWLANADIRLLEGLGMDYWADRPADAIPSDVAKSTPSLTFLGSGRWAVVYRREHYGGPDFGEEMVARVFDTSEVPSTFDEAPFFRTSDFTSDVAGRPAAMYLDGRLLIAWITSGGQPAIHLGFADVASDTITVVRSETFGHVAPECPIIASDPVLSHDHEAFYLGYLCKPETGSTESRLVIWKTAAPLDWDALGWERYGNWRRTPNGISLNAKFGFAGRADGSIVAGFVTEQDAFLIRCPAAARCEEPSAWEVVEQPGCLEDVAFGNFALIATGHPAQ